MQKNDKNRKSPRRRWKKVVKPSHRKGMVQQAVKDRGISIRLACETFLISETCYRNQVKTSRVNALIVLTYSNITWSFGLCFLYLRNLRGYAYNHERVYRIYKELELNLRIKPKRRLKRDKPETLAVPRQVNETWSMDFMHDRLNDGHSFRTFNVIDDYNREALGIKVDLSLPSARVICSLEHIIEWRGKPKTIRCDNGPEYISQQLIGWAE